MFLQFVSYHFAKQEKLKFLLYSKIRKILRINRFNTLAKYFFWLGFNRIFNYVHGMHCLITWFVTTFIVPGHLQSNLCITTTLGTQNLWPLLTGGRYSELVLCYKNWNWDPKIVVIVDKWSLSGGGH